MKRDSIKKGNILFNAILILQILIIILFLLYIVLLNVEFSNTQRKLVMKYYNENKIIGMSFEECEELFGEPYLLDENTACFDGGYYIKFDLGIIYSQGELVLTMDENQEIIYAHYNYSMDLPIWYFVL